MVRWLSVAAALAALGGCGPRQSVAPPPPPPAPADPFTAWIDDGAISLVDPALATRLGDDFDPFAARGKTGWYVELFVDPDSDNWTGVAGDVSLVDQSSEPLLYALYREGTELVVVPEKGSSLGHCPGAPAELRIRALAGARFEIECGETRELVAAEGPAARLQRWTRERIDAVLGAGAGSDSRIARGDRGWTFEGKPLQVCALLFEDCAADRQVASCDRAGGGAVRVASRAEGARVAVLAEGNSYAGAEKCPDYGAGIAQIN